MFVLSVGAFPAWKEGWSENMRPRPHFRWLAVVAVIVTSGLVLLGQPAVSSATSQAAARSLSSNSYPALKSGELLKPVQLSGAYGAIAYSPETGIYAAGSSDTSKEDAATDAVHKCQNDVMRTVASVPMPKGAPTGTIWSAATDPDATGCWAVEWFYNAIGAIAISGNGDYNKGGHEGPGWAAYNDPTQAEQRAENEAQGSCSNVSEGAQCNAVASWVTSSLSSSGNGGAFDKFLHVKVPMQTQLEPDANGHLTGHANCGPASVYMAMQSYGAGVTYQQTVDAIRCTTNSAGVRNCTTGATDFKGSSTVDWLKKHGLVEKDVTSLGDIQAALTAQHPVIILVKNMDYEFNYPQPYLSYDSGWFERHIVVVTGYNSENVVINDPLRLNNQGNYAIPVAMFQKAASDEGWYAASILPNKQ